MTLRFWGHAAALGLVIALGGCSSKETVRADAGASDAGPLDGEVARRFEEASAAGFSGAALVVVAGRPVLARGYGLADRETGTPNTVDTAFDFGSVMKDVTAAAIYRLVAAGKLATTDTLSKLLPEVPSDKAGITVLQILQHRAGFAEYHDDEGDFEPMTRKEARAKIFAQSLRFPPGTGEGYSNSGYTILADIVETVSNEPFTDYVRDEVFAPAGLGATGFFGDARFQQIETAKGYDAETFGENDPASWPYTWALVGNGGLVSTVGDLDRWATAATRDALYRTEYLDPLARDFEGTRVYTLAGAGDYGLGGLLVDCPSKSTRIIIASNAYDSFEIEPFALDLARFVLAP